MRVALFTETFLPRVDGVTHTLCMLLNHLEVRGHESVLFAPDAPGVPTQFARTRVVPLNGVQLPMYPDFKIISPVVSVRAALDQFAPDLIHTLNPIMLGLSAVRNARRLGVPVVASYHTDVPGFMRRWGYPLPARLMSAWMRWLHNQADLNLCPSMVTLKALEAQGYKRARVWTRGVDTTRFCPDRRNPDWCARLRGGAVEKPLLLFVGRLSHEKRVHWIRPIFDVLPDVRLAIVGDGPARASLERLFVNTPTVFTGALHGDDLAHAYASADIFVFPGANETFGNVILEAMASGLAVVAPRSGGFLDFATEGDNALLFSPEDQQEMMTLIQCLVHQPDTAQQMGCAARASVLQRSWATVMDRLLDDYAELIVVRRTNPMRVPVVQTMSYR